MECIVSLWVSQYENRRNKKIQKGKEWRENLSWTKKKKSLFPNRFTVLKIHEKIDLKANIFISPDQLHTHSGISLSDDYWDFYNPGRNQGPENLIMPKKLFFNFINCHEISFKVGNWEKSEP